MSRTRWIPHAVCRVVLLFLTAPAAFARPQQAALGQVDFPTGASPQAQQHFLRGVAALHSFWFEEALDAFREATRIENGFVMGYWGEAMAHNHPLWAEQDVAAARKVLENIRDTSRITPRERAYVAAVRVLYGEGDKLARDKAYAAAMEKIYRDYPDDLEAAAFYALSLLGAVRPGDKGFRSQARAGAIALDVFAKNPNHPGAAHYIIHAFDDPEHAILALPAARRYAGIAPEAHHARHMPSHIFLQLGMWPEAAAANQSAWEASCAWVARKNLSPSLRDYHSLHWWMYVALQQGLYSRAEELLDIRRKSLTDPPPSSGAAQMPTQTAARYSSDMLAAFIVETERWDLAAKYFAVSATATGGGTAAPAAGEHAAHGATVPRMAGGTRHARAEVLRHFMLGLAGAQNGSSDSERSVARLRELRSELAANGERYLASQVEIMEGEVAAMARAADGKFDEAIALLKIAAAREHELSPPSGPPDLIKPSHELYGEILLRAGRPAEAAQQFRTSLLRQPNRARSLLGAARAAARSGDRAGAEAAYASLLEIWKNADADLAALREAREFVRENRAEAAPTTLR